MFAWFPASLRLVHRSLIIVNPNILGISSFTVPRHLFVATAALAMCTFPAAKVFRPITFHIIIGNVTAKTPLEVISRNTLILDSNQY